MACIIVIWIHAIREQGDKISMGVFVDDRLLWARTKPTAVEHLSAAHAVTTQFNCTIGFRPNKDKFQLAATSCDDSFRLKVGRTAPDATAGVGDQFELPSIDYNTKDPFATTAKPQAVNKHTRGCARIAAARHRHRTRHMVRALAQPCLIWVGGFGNIDPATLMTLTKVGKNTIRGYVPRGCAPYMIEKVILEPRDDIAYQIDLLALRTIQWRTRRK